MNSLKLTAVVLRTVDYGESDRVVTLFTRERGKVSAFARGARASRRRFGGGLEPFTQISAQVRERSGSDLLSLDTLAVDDAFGGIRGDLARIACAGYAAELSRELVRDLEPHLELYDLLVDYLRRLDRGPALPGVLRAFELGALGAAGLAPRLDTCARCGGELGGQEAVRFDPQEGGALCAVCAQAASPGSVLLSRGAHGVLLRLSTGGLPAGAELIDSGVGREVRDALTRFVEHHLGRRLKARKFLDELGPALMG